VVTDAVPETTTSRPLNSQRPSGVRLGGLPVNSDEDLRFVQDRIGLFAKLIFLISSMFIVVPAIVDLLTRPLLDDLFARASHLTGTVLAFAVWRIAARKTLVSPRVLPWLDVVGTLAVCWAFAAMGHTMPQPYGLFTMLLAVTYVSIARAMIVPSIPNRTIWLSAASFGAIIVSVGFVPLPPEMLESGATRARGLLSATLWSTAGVGVATVASRVIYGLREIAREARQLGQYSLEEKIGEGGMGEVYRARHAMLRRPTAVKLLSGEGSESQLRRFEKEVQLTARLTHPNTISIFDYGRTPDGVFYYAMELLDGLSLEELVQEDGPQPAGRVIHIVRQVCAALKEAHGTGLIHRDIKPANIHLCRRGDVPDFVKVLDFGLVREVKSAGDVTRSNVDAVVGTPLYMSPESIVRPDRIDARADLYGLGCVAYHLVTGAPPFEGQTIVEVCAHHLHTPPPAPSRRRPVPDDLEGVILSCLAKAPSDRPESAEALSRSLARCRDAAIWTEADAETWWARRVAAAPPKPKPQAPAGGGQRTIVCDLVNRMSGREDTA
jgi:serine/threonine-protein kinase